MSFCTGELPRIFIMMIAIELGFLFKDNTSTVITGKRATETRLKDFHENFMKSVTVVSSSLIRSLYPPFKILDCLEHTYNKLILFVVS